MLAPVLFISFFYAYSITAPSQRAGQGFIMGYPMYIRTEFVVLHVMGTWMWIYIVTAVSSSKLNSKFSDVAYDNIVGSSMYAYLCHYFWIIVSA